MICQSCGHDYPSTLTRCTGCGQLNPRRMRPVSQSRLIEFPRQPRRDAAGDSSQRPTPSWRAEVSERVRAVKAKRSAEGAALQTARTAASLETPGVEAASSVSSSLHNNQLVEAALTRVRRAAGTGYSSSPNVTRRGSQSFAGAAGVSSDKDATAKALAPERQFIDEREPQPRPSRTRPLPDTTEQNRADSGLPARARPLTDVGGTRERTTSLVSAKSPLGASAASHVGASAAAQPALEYASSDPIDEIEPRDYLADEIKRVDKVLTRNAGQSAPAPRLAQIVATCVDLLIIGLTSAPFLALIELNNGVYSERSTKFAGVVMIGLVSFFYLALTHCARGRTFGMMLTGTRVVASGSAQPPTVFQGLLRAAGYYVAAAPAGLGLAWPLFGRSRRAWPDLISGTVVIKDN